MSSGGGPVMNDPAAVDHFHELRGMPPLNKTITMPDSLDELTQCCAALEETIAQLTDRLQPVIYSHPIPRPARDGQESETDLPGCELSKRVREAAQRIGRQRTELRRLMDDLDV